MCEHLCEGTASIPSGNLEQHHKMSGACMLLHLCGRNVQQLLHFPRHEFTMLHLLNQRPGFWLSEQTSYVAQTCTKACLTDQCTTAIALWAFHKLVRVLCALPTKCPPLASTPTHVTCTSNTLSAVSHRACNERNVSSFQNTTVGYVQLMTPEPTHSMHCWFTGIS